MVAAVSTLDAAASSLLDTTSPSTMVVADAADDSTTEEVSSIFDTISGSSPPDFVTDEIAWLVEEDEDFCTVSTEDDSTFDDTTPGLERSRPNLAKASSSVLSPRRLLDDSTAIDELSTADDEEDFST